jgi:YD repeat-containing protein
MYAHDAVGVRGFVAVTLAACGLNVAKPVVANRASSHDTAGPRAACPTQTLFGWEHEVWPACPTLPFRYDFDVCNGEPCPQPCRVEVEAHEADRPVQAAADATYDTRGRLTAMTPLAGEYIDNARCTYDGDRMTGCGGAVLAYDEHGRVTMVTEAPLEEYGFGPQAYAYDEHGRVRSMTIAKRDEDAYRYDYRYDDRGRVIRVDSLESGIHQHSSYRYGSDGRLVESENDFVTFHYSYDPRGRVVSVKDGRGEVALSYDDRGRLVREVTRDGPADPLRIHTYVYDCH